MLLCCSPLRYIIAWKLVPTSLFWSIGLEGNKWVFVRIGELKLVSFRHYDPGYKLVLSKGVLDFHLISSMPRILDFDGNSVFSFFMFFILWCCSLLFLPFRGVHPTYQPNETDSTQPNTLEVLGWIEILFWVGLGWVDNFFNPFNPTWPTIQISLIYYLYFNFFSFLYLVF